MGHSGYHSGVKVSPIVTFTTDFGTNEHYVGAMKGVVLGLNPDAHIVDICNAVTPFDVLDGALTFGHAYHYYPAGTVHVIVVDPGVGTSRRPIVVDTGRHLLIAPDNGVLSLVYEREERVTVRHVTAEHYFLQPVSNTFHGRDIFASVAGWVSHGVDLTKLGEVITDYVRFAIPKPKTSAGVTKGVVIKVDRFGNLITNLTASDLPASGFRLTVGKTTIQNLRTAYAQGTPGEVFAIVGSMGYVEISANKGAAAQLCGAGRGAEVTLG